jgi:PPE-repeat protein
MDFGMLPPEINSGRMYAGPGSASMLASAAAWDGVAAQLRSAAACYSSVVSGLTAAWQGPSATAMAAGAAPYAAWLNATAAQAEQTATQARAAATAYETAFAATVPPPVIAANRAQLAALVATNIVGQNMPAIAATEAQYADMWAQDAAAMYGYAGQSAAATQMTPFGPAPQTTNPGAAPAQSAAVAQAGGTSAGSGAQSALLAAVPSSLQALAAPTAPAQSSLLTTFLLDVLSPFGSLSPINRGLQVLEFASPGGLLARNALVSSTFGYTLAAKGYSNGELPVPLIPGVLYPPVATPAAATSALSAGLGQAASAELGGANTVGALSVPPNWAVATPEVRLAATVLQGTGPAAAPLVAASTQGGLLGEMALASLAGGAVTRAVPRAATGADAGKADPTADDGGPETTSADGKDGKTQEKLKRVLAELSTKPESVQHWHTDKAHLDALLEELSAKPGVHAVHVSARNKPNPNRPRWG